MPVDLFKPCTNPVSGETFQALSFDGNLYVTQWNLQPKGHAPFAHLHYNQDETFRVQQGEVRVMIDGKEHIAKAGESITVPKGLPHIAYNNTGGPLECVLEYRPGLDYSTFMQCYCGLVNDGYTDKKGGVDVPRMGYFLVKMKAKCMARPANIPEPVFRIALRFFYWRGVLSGWEKLYKKYTGE